MGLKETQTIWIAVAAAIAVTVFLGWLTFTAIDEPAERPFDYGTRSFVPGSSEHAVQPFEQVRLPRPQSLRRGGGAR